MKQHKIRFLFLALTLLVSVFSFSQDSTRRKIGDSVVTMYRADSLPKAATPIAHLNRVDSIRKHHPPKAAAIRSAILPGLGQIYNKKYWKLPIIYGALGITGSVFIYNSKNYRDLRFAYKAKSLAATGDSTLYPQIRSDLALIDVNALRSYRDEFRKNIDYSVLVFILFWGLNVVDATVDAHLKPFDVSPDLSLRIKIGTSEMARTTGISLVLGFK